MDARKAFEAWAGSMRFGRIINLDHADQDGPGDKLTYCELNTRLLWASWQAAQAQAAAPAFTTGRCKNKAQPGGCQLHNLQCGYPECDRQAAVEPPQYRAMWLAVKEELDILKLRGGNGEAGLVTATAPSEDSYSEPPHPTQPVATMWREKNTKLYPGIVFGLTDAGKDLPLGVRHQLYTSQPDNTAEMEALRKANLDCVDHFNVIKADY